MDAYASMPLVYIMNRDNENWGREKESNITNINKEKLKYKIIVISPDSNDYREVFAIHENIR